MDLLAFCAAIKKDLNVVTSSQDHLTILDGMRLTAFVSVQGVICVTSLTHIHITIGL